VSAGGTSAGVGGDGGTSGDDAGQSTGGTGAGGGGAGSSSGGGGTGGAEPEPGDAGADALLPDSGAPDAAAEQELVCLPSDQANCDALLAALVHRYSFEGTGTNVVDGVGSADGSVEGGQLSGSGSVVLDNTGAVENFVNLPNGILSSLSSVTLEAWVVWDGGDPWQRIFDFGTSNAGEGQTGGGAEYLFLATDSADDSTTPDVMRVGFLSAGSGGEAQLNVSPALASGVEKHVAVVMNGQSGALSLFVDGVRVGMGQSNALQGELQTLTDNNNWLGRSQFSTDAGFEGSLGEFRIYNAALSQQQVALSFDLGPDAPLSP
jgi:Concanavalin A-like lectin/glucanases superfamily